MLCRLTPGGNYGPTRFSKKMLPRFVGGYQNLKIGVPNSAVLLVARDVFDTHRSHLHQVHSLPGPKPYSDLAAAKRHTVDCLVFSNRVVVPNDFAVVG